MNPNPENWENLTLAAGTVCGMMSPPHMLTSTHGWEQHRQIRAWANRVSHAHEERMCPAICTARSPRRLCARSVRTHSPTRGPVRRMTRTCSQRPAGPCSRGTRPSRHAASGGLAAAPSAPWDPCGLRTRSRGPVWRRSAAWGESRHTHAHQALGGATERGRREALGPRAAHDGRRAARGCGRRPRTARGARGAAQTHRPARGHQAAGEPCQLRRLLREWGGKGVKLD